MIPTSPSPYRSSSPQPIAPPTQQSRVVVVAVNGDPGSDFAFRYAINHAASTSNDRIHLVNGRRDHSAINYAATGIPEHSPSDKAHKKQTTEAVLTKYATQCMQNKKNCTFESIDFLGGTNGLASQLCDKAKEQKASELVIGSTGKTALKRMLIGSVGQSAAEACPCNVTVVRRRSPPIETQNPSHSSSESTSPKLSRLSKSAPNPPSSINKWVNFNGPQQTRRASFSASRNNNSNHLNRASDSNTNKDEDNDEEDHHHVHEASQLIQNIML